MPMLTIALDRARRSRRASRRRARRSANARHPVEHLVDRRDDVLARRPRSASPRGARSAMCSTGRSSETLIRLAARASRRCAAAARPARRAPPAGRASRGVTCCLERSSSSAAALGAELRGAVAGGREQLAQRAPVQRSARARAARRTPAARRAAGAAIAQPTRRPRAPRAWRRSSPAARSTTSTNASAPLLCSSAASASTSMPRLLEGVEHGLGLDAVLGQRALGQRAVIGDRLQRRRRASC